MRSLDLPESIAAGGGSLPGLVSLLSRDLLDVEGTPMAWPSQVISACGQLEFRRLAGARGVGDRGPLALPVRTISGAMAAGHPLAFVLVGDGERVTVAVGTHVQSADAVGRAAAALIGAPPPTPQQIRSDWMERLSWGALVGIPSVAREGARSERATLADALLDCCYGSPFLMVIFATPEPADRARHQADTARGGLRMLEREHLQVGPQRGAAPLAERARDLLGKWTTRLDQGAAGRLWRVSVLLGTPSAGNTRTALGVLAGGLTDDREPSAIPMRGLACSRDPDGYSAHANLLLPAELESLCALPGRDRVGFTRGVDAAFDLDHQGPDQGVSLGPVLDGRLPLRAELRIPPEDLARHALLVGLTGSGKSTTCRSMLVQLHRQGVPFLVLEPAKAEYGVLASEIPGLLVLAAGALPSAGRTPLLLNPFAFPEGFPLQTHIDLLSNAFVASFGLVPPTPYLLESALVRVYEDRGWDLVTGTHPHGHEPLSFPTLSDLLRTIDRVVDEAGYHHEITSNLRAALRTRIGNLCVGAKGAMLDTRVELPFDELLASPAVVELERMGSDQEKALIMGLIVTRLYEQRRAAGPVDGGGLQHLLVVEEAHRLLRRVAERSSEDGNMAHQAVESFVNLLAEVRAYGQGVLVVEQLPSKLAPDVAKHAALKLVHRLTPLEDRDLVGDAMVLDDGQKRALAVLPTGQAVVHGLGMDGAVRVQVRPLERTHGTTRDASPSSRGLSPRAAWMVERWVAKMRQSRTLRQPAVTQAADAELLCAALGEPLRERRAALVLAVGSNPVALEAALEHALERRAVHYGWRQGELERLAEASTGDIAGFQHGLSVQLRATCGQTPACGACVTPCTLGYEAGLLAADDQVAEALDSLDELPAERWNGVFRAVVRGAIERRFGLDRPVSDVLLRCVVGQAVAGLGLSKRAASHVHERILTEPE